MLGNKVFNVDASLASSKLESRFNSSRETLLRSRRPSPWTSAASSMACVEPPNYISGYCAVKLLPLMEPFTTWDVLQDPLRLSEYNMLTGLVLRSDIYDYRN